MTAPQIDLPGLGSPKPRRKSKPGAATTLPHLELLHECRRRVAAGCPGHHEPGSVVAGYPFQHWRACPDCPVDASRGVGV